MASKEDLYISIEPTYYKLAKSNLLNSQANLLKILKHFQNLKVLARQKEDLKKRLYKQSDSVISEIRILRDKIPSAKLPKGIEKKEGDSKEIIQEGLTKKDSIEKELMAIQEKLRELNS